MAGKCFVIMPFGDKTDADGKKIDFDEIFDYMIKKAVESAGLECVRCDRIPGSGWIHKEMFENIYESDVAVVDITTLNPNVFYELGVRHALADCVTVLIRRKNTKIPFNIQDDKVIEYDETSPKSVDEAIGNIKAFIDRGLTTNRTDSLVRDLLSLQIKAEPKPIASTKRYRYKLKRVPDKFIGIVTGDIRNVKGIDVWVNSENTNMQMARHFERSISSVIRYCGAKTRAGVVIVDTIAKELAEAVGENANIPPGNIVVTGPGELGTTHGLKKIFHAAVVIGQPGRGYTPIQDVAACVRNAIDTADSAECKELGLRSMLFPLLGTGTAKGDVEQKSEELISTAICCLEECAQSTIQEIWFLNWTEREFKVCKKILDESDAVSASA